MSTQYAELLLDTGDLVRIEYNDKFEDEFWDAINNTMKRGDWFSPSMFDNCHAEYKGIRMDKINMRRVIGTVL